MLQVSSGRGSQPFEEIRSVEIPLAVRVLTKPIQEAGAWVWDVVVIRAKEDGSALLLLFFGSLGIFPTWVGLAMVVSGLAIISVTLSEARSEAIRFRDGYHRLRHENREMQKEVWEAKGKVGDSFIDNQELGNQLAQWKSLFEQTQKREEGRIAEQLQVLRERDELKRCNQNLQEKVNDQLGQEQEAHYEALLQALQQTVGDEKTVLDSLIQKWASCLETYHGNLQKAIDALEEGDVSRVSLRGILELSKRQGKIGELYCAAVGRQLGIEQPEGGV